MESVYKEYLFTKHIFIADKASEEKNRLEVLFSLANLFGIKITKGQENVSREMISLASECLGEAVPEPFYKGFPESVRTLEKGQALFDQILHYVQTYGLGDFSRAGHSVYEEFKEREIFKENTPIKEFVVVNEDEAMGVIAEIVKGLLAGTRPLSSAQYELICLYLGEHDFSGDIASKNTCVKLLMDLRNLKYTDYISMSDVIKLVEEMNYKLYNSTDIKKLNLKNSDRKFITVVIDKLIETGKCDIRNCFEKKKKWNGLLHHIHYKAKSEEGKVFVNAMRGRENLSVFSDFEKAMTERNIKSAVDILKNEKGKTAVLRNLAYILSRCKSEDEMQLALDCIDTKNTIVLLQLYIHFSQQTAEKSPRIFRFAKFNMLKVYTETEEEAQKRKSVISEETAKLISDRIYSVLKKNLSGKLGRVYIDSDMDKYALPIQETTSAGGFGVLTRGTRITIPVSKKIRAFTYWEKVNDIDLSCFGLEENGKSLEFSWRTMADKQSVALTYSGDQTSGYYGGSEYFDIDMELFEKEYPQTRYIIFCNNVFSGVAFANCFCKAGYMCRDVDDSGMIFEPKTVESSFMINNNSTFSYLYAIDLKTNELIWLNMARNGYFDIAGNTDMSFLIDYLKVTDVINVRSFFELIASETVANMADADVIVTNKNVEGYEDKEIIREYDFEKMIKLLN